MKISKLFDTKDLVVSFEVFPPKPDTPIEPILQTITDLEKLQPDFISVTYGAAGSSRGQTMDIAEYINKANNKVLSLAHLTSIVNTPEEIDEILSDMQKRNITNILALRGDPPKDSSLKARKTFAKDLVAQIKQTGHFGIAAAAYPEGHPECLDKKNELLYLKEKIDAGADFLITQIFFDNDCFYKFAEKLDNLNVKTPISAGIMPVFSAKQVARICQLCQASIPEKLSTIMNKYQDNPEDMEKAGLEYAYEQISDLVANKVRGIHLYTMNKPELARSMVKNTKLR